MVWFRGVVLQNAAGAILAETRCMVGTEGGYCKFWIGVLEILSIFTRIPRLESSFVHLNFFNTPIWARWSVDKISETNLVNAAPSILFCVIDGSQAG